jgi:hypothetical protein
MSSVPRITCLPPRVIKLKHSIGLDRRLDDWAYIRLGKARRPTVDLSRLLTDYLFGCHPEQSRMPDVSGEH